MAELIQKIYNLKYGVDIGYFKRDPNDKKTWNTSDAMVFIPITRDFPAEPNKGNKQLGLFTVDGHFKTPIPDFELLECTLFLVQTLLKSQELDKWHKKELRRFAKNFAKEAKHRGCFKQSD